MFTGRSYCRGCRWRGRTRRAKGSASQSQILVRCMLIHCISLGVYWRKMNEIRGHWPSYHNFCRKCISALCDISLYNSTPTLILPLPKTPGIPQTPFMCRVMYRCLSCSSHPGTRYCITSSNDPKILGRTSTRWCLVFLVVRRRHESIQNGESNNHSMVCSLVTCPLMASFTSHHATAN